MAGGRLGAGGASADAGSAGGCPTALLTAKWLTMGELRG
ncbi:hypothetical protein ATKI12_1822 [Kitasatospora sp. Ki12]